MSKIIHGDSLVELAGMEDASVDAIVTDPPYGLGKVPDALKVIKAWAAGEEYSPGGKGFMGQEWDAFVPSPAIWKECFRVLKPGGHLLSFAGTKTLDLMGLGIRLGGFEVRDCLQWVYGSGMPKGCDMGKAFDKREGAEPKVIGYRTLTGNAAQTTKEKGGTYGSNTNAVGVPGKVVPVTRPSSPLGKKWEGWKTGLKPSWEPIILARKPFTGSLVENVFQNGVGPINTLACSVPCPGGEPRYPANTVMDEEAGAILDAQAGPRRGMSGGGQHREGYTGSLFGSPPDAKEGQARGDNGGPSRFFYCAKASKAEKEQGLEVLKAKSTGERKNIHPTVKPIALMEWLVRMVTPPGGLVLDPFCGSGSTGIAAKRRGFRFVGIEREGQYVEVARARIEAEELK